MALHSNIASMAIEAIDEYIIAADLCLASRKPDGGCLGYPATLLLFCVVNALVTYLKGQVVLIENKHQKITAGEPFRVLNHTCFGFDLSHKEIKLLEGSYRNALAHNAIILPGAFLVPSAETPPFIFDSGKVGIRVFSFLAHVSRAWAQIPKEDIQAWENRRVGSK